MPEINSLQTRAADNLSFADALAQCRAVLPDAVALLYAPHFCAFAQLQSNGTLTAAQGVLEIEFLATVFEARLFTPQVELRWWHQQGGTGRTVLLTDDQANLALDNYLSSPDQQSLVGTIEQTYLLWGKGVAKPAELPASWSRLTTARIGRLHIPAPNVTCGYVHLKVREYLAETDQHGNVAVVEERLLELVPATLPTAKKGEAQDEPDTE